LSKEFGDFQTPLSLVATVLQSLSTSGKTWTRVLEPTCGRGNFIEGLLKQTNPPREIQGIELQETYCQIARKLITQSSSTHVVIEQANIFDVNLREDVRWREQGPLLVIGNPPWVTNAELGVLESKNLPQKTNMKGLRGLDARTGDANFDIAEYIWLKLIRELAPEHPTIALLCKTSVARHVLQAAAGMHLPITDATLRLVDARKWFDVSVDACLFIMELGAGEPRYEAAVYRNLRAIEPEYTIGMVEKRFVANVEAYEHISAIDGSCPLMWRQGLKHDAAPVMELIRDGSGQLRNKLDEVVVVEPDYIYPLVKSTDIFHGAVDSPKRAVIVTQRRLGEDTCKLRQVAPQLWRYLTVHAGVFEQRKSSIYENQPRFALFGIGDYSFAPYKVAISGFHKAPRFRAIGPQEGRPVMLDDTCYFIPCNVPLEAALLASLLNDPLALSFINSVASLEAKRPITKKLLQRLDLLALFKLIEKEAFVARVKQELARLGAYVEQDRTILSATEALLTGYAQNNDRASPSSEDAGAIKQLTWL
jgi:hypothetical protein